MIFDCLLKNEDAVQRNNHILNKTPEFSFLMAHISPILNTSLVRWGTSQSLWTFIFGFIFKYIVRNE